MGDHDNLYHEMRPKSGTNDEDERGYRGGLPRYKITLR